jgi:hypothetical protein
VVTYRHRVDDEGLEHYRLGVVDGPIAPDPTTAKPWVGVRLPRCAGSPEIDFIAVASIVNTSPL